MRADLPLHASPEAQAAYVNGLRERLRAALDAPGVLERFTAARDDEDLGRLHSVLPHLTGLPADPELCVRMTTGRARVMSAADNGAWE